MIYLYFNDMKIKINPTTYLVWLVLIFTDKADFLLCSLVCAILHECSHIAAYLSYGTYVTEVEFLPFGLSARVGKTENLSCSGECFCALCGPMINLFMSAGFVFLSDSLLVGCEYFVVCNLALFSINMLPVIPLDGGRVLYFILLKYKGVDVAARVSRIISIFIVIVLLLIGALLLFCSGYNAFVLFIGCYLLVYVLTADSCF